MISKEYKIFRHNAIIDIKGWIITAKEQNAPIDLKKLVLMIREKFELSDRTAKDFLNLALFSLNLSKEDLLKEKQKIIL